MLCHCPLTRYTVYPSYIFVYHTLSWLHIQPHRQRDWWWRSCRYLGCHKDNEQPSAVTVRQTVCVNVHLLATQYTSLCITHCHGGSFSLFLQPQWQQDWKQRSCRYLAHHEHNEQTSDIRVSRTSHNVVSMSTQYVLGMSLCVIHWPFSLHPQHQGE